MSDNAERSEAYLKYQLEDSASRVRYAHEFALAGMRTLIFINGGAVIGLLTYAGNVLDKHGAASLGDAFLWYISGMVSTTLAYVFAYLSQNFFVHHSGIEAQRYLGIAGDEAAAVRAIQRYARGGSRSIAVAIILAVGSLAAFVIGSVTAMRALT